MPVLYAFVGAGATPNAPVWADAAAKGGPTAPYRRSAAQMLAKTPKGEAGAGGGKSKRYTFDIDDARGAHALVVPETTDAGKAVVYGLICTSKTAENVTTGVLAAARAAFERDFSAAERQHLLSLTSPSAAAAIAGSFANTLQRLLRDEPESSEINAVKQHVSDVKLIMQDNIEKVLARGEQLETVAAKADNLQAHARDFHTRGRALRRRMWWKDMRLKLLIGAAVVVLVLIVFFWACDGVKCV